jgi:glucan phosphorylase
MIKYRIGGDFLKKLDKLATLKPMIDEDMVRQFNAIKRQKKEQLCAVIAKREGIKLNPDFMFDVQVKRLHEYKRQHLNALHILYLYRWLRENPNADFTPHTFRLISATSISRCSSMQAFTSSLMRRHSRSNRSFSSTLSLLFTTHPFFHSRLRTRTPVLI